MSYFQYTSYPPSKLWKLYIALQVDQVLHAVLREPVMQNVPTEQRWEGYEGDRCSFWRLCMWVTIIRKKENENKTKLISTDIDLTFSWVSWAQFSKQYGVYYIKQITKIIPFTIIETDSAFILFVIVVLYTFKIMKKSCVPWNQRILNLLYYTLINSILSCFTNYLNL